jgi:uncharacterized protein YodC (DUF2158 family)
VSKNVNIGKVNIDQQTEPGDRDFKVGDLVRMRNGGNVTYTVAKALPDGTYVCSFDEGRDKWTVKSNWIEKVDVPPPPKTFTYPKAQNLLRPGMVSITISRGDADYMAEDEWVDERLARIAAACRAALEETE